MFQYSPHQLPIGRPTFAQPKMVVVGQLEF
jgi:hypothetical protein